MGALLDQTQDMVVTHSFGNRAEGTLFFRLYLKKRALNLGRYARMKGLACWILLIPWHFIATVSRFCRVCHKRSHRPLAWAERVEIMEILIGPLPVQIWSDLPSFWPVDPLRIVYLSGERRIWNDGLSRYWLGYQSLRVWAGLSGNILPEFLSQSDTAPPTGQSHHQFLRGGNILYHRIPAKEGGI